MQWSTELSLLHDLATLFLVTHYDALTCRSLLKVARSSVSIELEVHRAVVHIIYLSPILACADCRLTLKDSKDICCSAIHPHGLILLLDFFLEASLRFTFVMH